MTCDTLNQRNALREQIWALDEQLVIETDPERKARIEQKIKDREQRIMELSE